MDEPLMKGPPPDETTIRRYLLGRLDTTSPLAEELEDRMLTDEEFAEIVGVIEDEILEEYLDGVLDPADKQAVEKHFTRSPERRQKLRLMRRLNQHLAAEPENIFAKQMRTVPRAGTRFHWRTLIEIAAGVTIVVTAAVYIVHLRQGFQREIGSKQAHVKQLTQQLEELQNLQQNSAVELSLLQPGRLRSGESLPSVEIKPSTRLIHTEVRIQDRSAGPCDVRLVPSAPNATTAADKKTIWLQVDLHPRQYPTMALLIVDLPTNEIKPGKYDLLIRQHPSDTYEISYPFEVRSQSTEYLKR